MSIQLFCDTFGELFNERHLVPVLHDFYACNRVLLIITVHSHYLPTQSIIIPKSTADIIKFICDKYSKFSSYRDYLWTVLSYDDLYAHQKLYNVDFVYIYDDALINAFEKIYGSTSYGCEHLYEDVLKVIKICFRRVIEKSVSLDERYDVSEDRLELSDLSIVDGKIRCRERCDALIKN
jgi:hypothetical protein